MEIIEIMGKDLDLAFKELNANARKTFESADGFQVWDIAHSKLEEIENSDWKSEYGWWRYGYCTLEGSDTFEYTVNDQIMNGWSPSYNTDEENEILTTNKYISYIDWLDEVFNLSKEINKVVFAKSLARENNISLKEFMSIYQK